MIAGAIEPRFLIAAIVVAVFQPSSCMKAEKISSSESTVSSGAKASPICSAMMVMVSFPAMLFLATRARRPYRVLDRPLYGSNNAEHFICGVVFLKVHHRRTAFGIVVINELGRSLFHHRDLQPVNVVQSHILQLLAGGRALY